MITHPAHTTRASSTHSPRSNRNQITRSSSNTSLSRTTTTPSLSRPGSSSGRQRRAKVEPQASLDPDPTERDNHQYMADTGSPTPTPRRRNPRQARPRKQTQRSGVEGEDGDGEGGEDELFGLLGISSPAGGGDGRREVNEGRQVRKERDVKDVKEVNELRELRDVKGRKGVLAVSKADIEASGSGVAGGKKPNTRSKRDPREAGGGDSGAADGTREARTAQSSRSAVQAGARGRAGAGTDTTTQSENDAPFSAPGPAKAGGSTPKARQPRSRSSKPPQAKTPQAQPAVSGISAQLAAHPPPPSAQFPAIPIATSSSSLASAFDTASLSRSLPSDSVFAPSSRNAFLDGSASAAAGRGGKGRRKKGGESEDESKVWDDPTDPGPSVVQEQTVSFKPLLKDG